jgi:gliotoxin/aspirochlorine biosynthesis aminotransferase
MPPEDGGDQNTRETLAKFFNTYFAPIHTVKMDHIVLTAGATDAIENLIHAICDDGDSVIVPGPYWCMSINRSLNTSNTRQMVWILY